MKKEKITLEKGMYLLGILSLILGIPFLILFHREMQNETLPACYILEYLGFYCPGCGGSRAVKALLDGKFLLSLYYHPVVIYTAAIYLVFMASQTLHIISHGKVKGIRFHYWFLYGALVIIIINFLVKNIWKFCFDICLL